MGCECKGATTACIREEVDKTWSRLTASIIGILLILCSVISITCGALMLKYGSDFDEGPWKVASPIWTGIIAFLCGLFGVLIGMQLIPVDVRRVLFYVQFGFGIATISTTGQLFNHTVRGYSDCTGKIKSYCIPNNDKLVTLSIVILAMGTMLMLLGIGVILYYITLHYKAYKCTPSVDPEDKEPK